MRRYLNATERLFETFSEKALSVFGNSITFIIVCALVIYWITESLLIKDGDWHDQVRDLLLGISFLNFFIIQKSVNRYSKAIHIKLNELVLTHEHASNDIVNAENKTEEELEALTKKYENETPLEKK